MQLFVCFTKGPKASPASAGEEIGGGGGTAYPSLSTRAGLYLHPVARMRGVLSTAQNSHES